MNKYSFSIFTPSYNRGGYLNQVFDSLKKQTYKNFEWIVINDGSTDNTDEIMKKIIEQSDFQIVYVAFETNKGKHIAQNYAVEIAKGELFAPLDSDDYIVPNALEIFWNEWNSISLNEKEQYSGIGVHCMNSKGELIGDTYPNDRFVSNDLDISFKYNIKGEKWGVIRTDIMKQFKNEEVKGHFLSESTVWYRIARKYTKKLYLQKALRVYEVQNDSVTRKMKDEVDFNIDSRIVADCIFMNEFYDYYLKYQFKRAIRIPVALTYKCIVNERPILIGQNSLFSKVKQPICKLLIIIASGYKPIWYIRNR